MRTYVLNYSCVRLLIENFNMLKVALATTKGHLRPPRGTCDHQGAPATT